MLTAVVGELGKLLGTKWKELDEEEKKVCTAYIVCYALTLTAPPALHRAGCTGQGAC